MSVTTRTYSNRNKYWYFDGMLHRDDDLPAVEFINGTKYWYQNGQLHRSGILPAMEYADGTKEWCIYGKFCTREKLVAYYSRLVNFGRYCLKKIRQRRLKRVRWTHGELLCRPSNGNYLGGQDYYKMTNYFDKL